VHLQKTKAPLSGSSRNRQHTPLQSSQCLLHHL
jgi:hypothetical protein